MKILISSFTFPPNKDGVSEAAAVMAAGFLEKGWEVEIATSPTDPARNGFDWFGAKVHEFAIQGNSQRRHSYSGDVGIYRTFLQQGDWDVVIFHAYLWSLYIPLDILEKIQAKTILVSHGYPALQWVRVNQFPWGLWSLSWSIYRALEMCFWIKKIDRIVYLSDRRDFRGFCDHWIAKALNHQGRRVIPNGVDPILKGANPGAFRRHHQISEDQIVFLCVANYSRRKAQDYAARAFRSAGISDAVMIFIGSEFNSDSTRFQEEDERLSNYEKSGRIIWLEKIDRNTTLDAFAACHVFVISSDHEAQPIALLEAMRESKPWIARDSGCISEMPGGVCVHTEAEMSRQMTLLAAQPAFRHQLGIRGREAVEGTYNRQHYIDSYCSLVSELSNR
jgi:glycosyltransferase involved in cell wall biosynthesis